MSTKRAGTRHFHITGKAEWALECAPDHIFLFAAQNTCFTVACDPKRERCRGRRNLCKQGLQNALPITLVERIGARSTNYRSYCTIPAKNDQKRLGPAPIYRRDAGGRHHGGRGADLYGWL